MSKLRASPSLVSDHVASFAVDIVTRQPALFEEAAPFTRAPILGNCVSPGEGVSTTNPNNAEGKRRSGVIGRTHLGPNTGRRGPA